MCWWSFTFCWSWKWSESSVKVKLNLNCPRRSISQTLPLIQSRVKACYVMFTSNHSYFLLPVWLFQWSVRHFQVGAPIKPLFLLQYLSLSGVPAVKITLIPICSPCLRCLTSIACLLFFSFPFPPQSSPCFLSFFSVYPSFSFRLSLFHSFVDEHLYCWWRLLELEMCQKSCHGSKRMSQAFSVIKPTVAKCTGRQWRFVDDNFFFFFCTPVWSCHLFSFSTFFFSSSCGSN